MIEATQNEVRGCYLHYRDVFNNTKPGGIEKKVAAQIGAFNNAGLVCDFILCKQPETTGAKVLSCLPFISDGINWPNPESMSAYSFIYIRRPRFASKELLRFLKNTKSINPEIKILYEIPTYPYDGEMKNIVHYPALIKDRRNRKRLQTYVDRIVSLSDDEEIFETKTIRIMNGIDLSRVAQKEPAPSLEEVNIIVVASFEPWHGLDRLINGVITYYRNGTSQRKVVLHIVGNGSVVKPLTKQIEEAGLNDRLLFHGYCGTDELDALYNRCSLAVECLGVHRRSESLVSSSLKSREYLAKGIPFVCATEIDVFINNPVDFCLRLPSNESPVDIVSLLSFHDGLYDSETQESLIKRIRTFAETHIGMNQAMAGAISYLENRSSGTSG